MICECGKGDIVTLGNGQTQCTETMKQHELQNGEIKRCGNCASWHKNDYRHCQNSGPWGGNLIHDDNCKWEPLIKPSQPKPTFCHKHG